MVCSQISSITNFADLLVWPTGCFYYFWLVVIGFIWGTVVLIVYNTEREKFVKADMISTMAVTSIAFCVLSGIGTLIQNTSGIPMIQDDIFLYILAFTIVWTVIWQFKK